jgi:enterochelin esterase-like enzyme
MQFRPSLLAAALLAAPILTAQAPAPARPPAFVSPEVQSDRRVTFRIHAPNAQSVRLNGGDMPGVNQQGVATKGENGVWEATVGPLDAGAYRYRFTVDGLGVIDPRNPKTSESNDDTWSLVVVPGSDLFDTRQVPHGAVAAVTYYSTSLGRARRMHVYTPPGYGNGGAKYPVFYLLHGSSDSDASWSTVGRAGFILDNLIADKKAKPMIVVMPAGHTTPLTQRGPNSSEEFAKDFSHDLLPYVEKNYRVLADRGHRAIAGLSMGGSQTLLIAFAHLEQFGYVGVFSSGVVGAPRTSAGAPPVTPGPGFEERNKAALDNASLKKGLKLLWIATGKEDAGRERTVKTVEMFKAHGFSPVYKESGRGHVWLNWRDYLAEFAPQLFR